MLSRNFNLSDLTVVMQGAVGTDSASRSELIGNIAATRRALPGATLILSTWVGSGAQIDWPVDHVVESDDPGELPNFKYNSPGVMNNVNRQIVSSRAGLESVKTRYAIKMRTDCRFDGTGFLDAFLARDNGETANNRIVVPHLFSVDPRVFEQMPFHLSDWFQFGETGKLRDLWCAPPMAYEDATYYDTHAHASWSSRFDRRYRARFAPEQHVWTHYAGRAGYVCPGFHNDVSYTVLNSHDRFLSREVQVVDVAHSGFVLPRYGWALRSGFQRFNCLNAHDWSFLEAHLSGRTTDAGTQMTGFRRLRAKRFLSALASCTEPLAPMLTLPLMKPLVSRFLKGVDAWSARTAQY
ncbi:WavE lipopolysaccharide synthesis family protein [Paraburkholderia caballeronis]|uniref:WavE lipopolysaccharide synthesis n=1 Tax=Paraburkholderia caballeronis TaxID=416943 RepID=A0A1H7H8I3_9BURK|nr:WavE lipopolysaccharide synthesis family protein [Paraburkholderia caballeronis]PXW29608.1 WavE lipopolysaccharide synthesis protein [Paraburkholderia caballeronis]PXX04867.1 WavE lipopolysaccharide synthesis protein [Paraburkholderia caballeronis]RAK05928.1 WavE lipopolysaccharide synthesis protein [Paraburkholderia caballeronis]TDV11120.1 WavE lipopolysaccharide synthesis protein [Paraburkholderia caballeronis]TDV14190.1 WavE lipopolysaccharide synthesis protein [Paraburkholderia caballer